MTICLKCRRVYRKYDRPHTCKCNYKTQTIDIPEELMNVVQKLMNMGLKVEFADCQTYPMYQGNPRIKTTTITVEMGDLYPDAMFAGLPDGWIQYEYRRVVDATIGEYRFTGLSCTEHHPECESDTESVEFAKRLMVSNLECWLNERDADGYYAVWRLAGVL